MLRLFKFHISRGKTWWVENPTNLKRRKGDEGGKAAQNREQLVVKDNMEKLNSNRLVLPHYGGRDMLNTK